MKCDNCNHYIHEFANEVKHSSYEENTWDGEGYLLRLTKQCQYRNCSCDKPEKDTLRKFKESLEEAWV